MKVSIKTIRFISIIILLSIILSGASILSYMRIPRIILCGILAFLGICMIKKNKTFSLTVVKIWSIWIGFLFITSIFSYMPKNTIGGAVIYLCFFLLTFLNFCEKDMKFLIKMIRGVCILFAITIIVSVVIPNLFTEHLSFLIATNTKVIKSEILEGIYSGLAGEKSNAAFYMNIGIALEVSLYNSAKKLKLKNYIIIALYIIALMLTGKRTLLVVSLMIIGLAIKMFNIKGKVAKVIVYSAIIIPVIFVVLNCIPQTQVVIQRLSENTSDGTLNGRTKFWDFCIYMFKNKPLIGYGYDTFNQVFGDIVHYVYNGSLWNMYAHNIYYELLGETGIIGLGLFIIAIVTLLIKSIVYFKYKHLTELQRTLMFFSIAIQIIFIIYGYTGNVIYSHYQLGFYFTALIIYKVVVLDLYKGDEIKLTKNIYFKEGEENET